MWVTSSFWTPREVLSTTESWPYVSVPPNIWRSSVIGCVQKYELSKKGVTAAFFSWNRGFSRQEGAIYGIYEISDSKDVIKIGKNKKNRENTADD